MLSLCPGMFWKSTVSNYSVGFVLWHIREIFVCLGISGLLLCIYQRCRCALRKSTNHRKSAVSIACLLEIGCVVFVELGSQVIWESNSISSTFGQRIAFWRCQRNHNRDRKSVASLLYCRNQRCIVTIIFVSCGNQQYIASWKNYCAQESQRCDCVLEKAVLNMQVFVHVTEKSVYV